MIRLFLPLLISTCAWCAVAPFTLDDALSAPFPSNLVSNGHGRIAWLQTVRGVRNIWVAESPAFKGSRITTYTEDDGTDITDLSLSADGVSVVFTRGQGENAQNEIPNPRHLVSGVEQSIQIVPFAGGATRQLAVGHSPAIAPDSSNAAFVSGGQVWLAPLTSSAAATQLTHNRGKASHLSWSPDSRAIAFTSHRALHSEITVYQFGKNSLQFPDPGSDFDDNPAWSPDSKQIAFTRIPSTLDWNMHKPRRTAETPWSIRVADLTSGTGREIWQAASGPGSVFHEITSDSQIYWTAHDRIVFPWERTGWLHLYTVPAQGGAIADLMPLQTDGEVEDVALSPDRSEVLYSSNAGDPERRHIYRGRLDRVGSFRKIASNALEWSPVFAAKNEIAILHSDAHQPARAAVVAGDKIQDLAPETIRNDFPLTNLTSVEFPAADGMLIHGELFLPPDGKAKHPAVIFLHGGSRREMLLGWHPMFYYNQAYGFNKYLASRGYVVLSLNYRSGIGYGLNFREALDYGPSGGSEYNDVVGAAHYLQSRKDIIPNKIGLWGGSYGGYLTALGLARNSDLFAAGVDLEGVHNWNDEMEDSIPADQPNQRQKLAEIALQSSPLASIATWRSPVLLIQGDDDRDVDFRQTEIMVEALRKQHVPFEELIFPDEVHDFLRHDHWLAAYQATESFLDKYLTK